jgi:hypothetical protein
MPKVGAYDGGEKKPMFDWNEAHNEFSGTLYALLASEGVIGKGATRCENILVAYQFSGSGLQVLQDMMCLHHLRHIMTQAPTFTSVKSSIPLMPANVVAGDQLNLLTVYFMAFGNWEAHLKLYPDAKYMRETEFHLSFIDGLAAPLKKDRSHKKRTIFWNFVATIRQAFPRIPRRLDCTRKASINDSRPL